jgi:uncharacterized membrane protein YdjX (TVP38/TMEM64 family)
MKKSNVKVLLFLVLATVSIAIIVFLRSRGVGLESLIAERDRLLVFVQRNAVVAGASFIVLYILVVAFSIPGGTALTLLGGFFFGPFVGLALVNVGATIGAFLIFMAARYLMRDALMARYGDQLAKLNKELERNGASYLLTLRFIPLFPFFLINLLAGLTPVSAFTYLWTTAIGIIPGSFVYALLGSSGATMDSTKSAFSPQLLAGLVLLGIVSLIPVGIRKFGKSGVGQSSVKETQK